MSNILADSHTNQTKQPVPPTQQASVSTTHKSLNHPEEQLEIMQFIEMEDVLSKMDEQIEFNNRSTAQPSQHTTTTTNTLRQSKTVQQPIPIQKLAPIPIQKPRKKEFIITTRCGQLQLTFERVLSFFVMILTISILLIMSILSTGTIVIQSTTEDTCYLHVTSILVNLNSIKSSFDIMLNTSISQQKLLSEVNTTMIFVSKELDLLIVDIPGFNKVNNLSRESVIPELRANFNNFKAVQTTMFNNIVKNVRDFSFYRNNYLVQLQIFVTSLEDPLIIADRAAKNEDLYMNYSASINLILVAITLLIIVPVMLIVLFITIGRDNLFLDKLKKVDAHVVLDVMEDQHSQARFKEFCKQQDQYSKFLFLEKVLLYKEQCEKIYEIHDQIEILSDVSGSETAKGLSHDIDLLEAKKFELAFEILTEFLDDESESFLGTKLLGGRRNIEKVKKIFDSKSMNLPDKLFKSFQTNVAIDLLQTYKQFQIHQKKQREEKKKNRLLKIQQNIESKTIESK